MAIIVTCPGCRKSFSVKDEFAGRTGPCPNCKTIITIPKLDQKVKLHGGEAFSTGGRNAQGTLVLKPIKRRQNKLTLQTAGIGVGALLALFVLTWLLGLVLPGSWILALVELICVTPALVFGGYYFLRDAEALKDLEGKDLYMRIGICSLVYVLLWVGFVLLSSFATSAFGSTPWVWLMVGTPFALAGAWVSTALLELEFGDGAVHIAVFLMITALLGVLLQFAFTFNFTGAFESGKPGMLEDPRG